MTKVVSTTLVTNDEGQQELVKQEHDIADSERGISVIVHQQGIKVDVPDFVEVNAQDTIRCMEEMTQNQWEWISKGGIFAHLWEAAFDPCDHTAPPEKIEVLNMMDMGMRHVAGMIVLGCEACMAKKSVFFRNPETYLHPKTERYIMTMFEKMIKLLGSTGTVEIDVLEHTKVDGTKVEAHKVEVDQRALLTDDAEDKLACLQWLQVLQNEYGPGKEIVDTRTDAGRLTVEQLTEAINQGTPRGLWFVEEFAKMRDGRIPY